MKELHHTSPQNIAEYACSISTSKKREETAVQKGKDVIYSMIQKKADSHNLPIGLYCDGKLVQELTDGKLLKNDRQTELLGIPCTDYGTGRAQVDLMQPLLEQFNLMDKIKFMCFDRTVSKTGQNSGVCIGLVKLIQHPILYLGCRHYVNKRHVVHFWKNYSGSKTTGTDNPLFKKLKPQWNDINTGPEIEVTKLIMQPVPFYLKRKQKLFNLQRI